MANYDDYLGWAQLGIGALGAVASGFADRKTAREYNEGQMRLAQYQNEFNEGMWNKSNAYNAPANQMKLMKEAGLNPNLIYSQHFQAASAPEAATPNLQPVPSVGSAFGKAAQKLQVASLKANLDLTKSQINKNNAEAGKAMEETGLVASNKERNTIFNFLYGTDEFAANFQSMNSTAAHQADIDYRRSVSEYLGLLGGEEDMSYWELERRKQSFKTGLARLEYNLTNDYGAKHEMAVIYNLIYGTKAAQASAHASQTMANVANDRLGFDKQRYEDVRQAIISRYGSSALESRWSALYMMKKYFGQTFEQVMMQGRLDQSKMFKLIDVGMSLIKMQNDNMFKAADLLF